MEYDSVKEIRVVLGKYKIKVTLCYKGLRIFVKFPFHRGMIAEVKTMQGHKWHGYDDSNPRKIWSIANSIRNNFQLEFLQGLNPYAAYDGEYVDFSTSRPLYAHQIEMVRHALTRHYCIFACEMGTGKTLAAIEVMEHIGVTCDEAWYVGPKSGIIAVNRQFNQWDSKIRPEMYTYEGLRKVMTNWISGVPAPKLVIFDESSKIKTPTAKRSIAALKLADAVREEHRENGYVILMSGTPAPKTPVDWWNQCEVACPGFIKEGDVGKFKRRLCLTEERQSISGGVYPHLLTWLDDENKCAECGEFSGHINHTSLHDFKPSVNEVSFLYKRMKGLVLVQFKKDCLDLPDKQYTTIMVEPTVSILRTAKLITKTSPRAIQALTLLRELSDGFQYTDEMIGTQVCPNCKGEKKVDMPMPVVEIELNEPQDIKEEDFENQLIDCPYCGGTGSVPEYRRATKEIDCPKDQAFIDLLDEHEDGGRFVVWGGFTGTIDRLVGLAHKFGWATLKVDGRGYVGLSATKEPLNTDELLSAMDLSDPNYRDLLVKYPRVCFVGHPRAGGMALTLTASPTALYFSNDFSGEARQQSTDRIHRMGMDVNKGATIIDLIHLPTDKLVMKNLNKKKRLQDVSMGELAKCLD